MLQESFRKAAIISYAMLAIGMLLGLSGSTLGAINESTLCPTCEHPLISEYAKFQNRQDIYASQVAAPNLKMQLGFALDGSGSIVPANWDIILDGLSQAIESNDLPKDGTVELTVVQFGVTCPGYTTWGAEVEIPPTIITVNNYQAIANDIRKIVQGNGNTPLSCGLRILADTMFQSNNFDPALKQVVNVITDGEPNVCCDSSSYCGNSCDSLSARNSSVDARNYLKSKLQLHETDDRITSEFIGDNTVFRDWIKDQIVWPQPGQIATPYPSKFGWVRMVQSYQEVVEAIREKVRVSIPQPPKPVETKPSENYDSIQVGNDEARSISDYWSTHEAFGKKAIAVNNLEIKKNQDSGECNPCNNTCQNACSKSNLEKIKIGDRMSFTYGIATGTNNIKIITNQE